MRASILTSALILVALIMASGCDMQEGNNTVVGSSNDTPVYVVTFSVDTTYIDGSGSATMVAKGRASNVGKTSVSSPWYIEGQFYTDPTFHTKLGGSNTEVGVPLSPGQSTVWTLRFSSSNINAHDYPEFRVGDLRGVYKQ